MFIVSSTNWALLRSQKLTLIQVIGVSPPAVADDLTGILHLIDALQDEADLNNIFEWRTGNDLHTLMKQMDKQKLEGAFVLQVVEYKNGKRAVNKGEE